MIYYLVTREHAYTITRHLLTWGKELEPQIQPIFWDQIARQRQLKFGTYIFSDLERLSDAYMDLARTIAKTLASISAPMLNAPHEVLRREPLLRKLHAANKNPFAVHSIQDDPAKIRFPVFLRRASEHDGSRTSLITNAQQLKRAISRQLKKRVKRDDLLIVEFCSTADAHEQYKKYSAFRVGNQIIARHLFVGPNWMLKIPTVINADTVALEQDYLTQNPHENQLKEIFDIAGINYGRIDYSLLNDQIVTWEINTNPIISVPPKKLNPARFDGQSDFSKKFTQAIKAIDASGEKTISFEIPTSTMQKLHVGFIDRLANRTAIAMRQLAQQTPFRQVRGAAEFVSHRIVREP